MKDEEKKALEILEELFGPEIISETKNLKNEEPEFADAILNYAIPKVWARPGLSLLERSLVTISSQAALGRWDQVKTHSESFLRLGGTVEQLREVFLQLSVYCGFPATKTGLEILRDISNKK